MLIVCPTCATSYEVQVASLGDTGRSVRCVRCRTVWFASPPMREEAHADAAAAEAAAGFAQADPAGAGGGEPDSAAAQAGEPAVTETDWGLPDSHEPAGDSADADAEPVEQVLAAEEAPPLAPADPVDPATIEADFAPATARSGHKGPRRLRAGIRRGVQTSARSLGQARLDVRKLGLPGLIVLMVGVVAAIIAWRVDIVRVMPQTASFYAMLGFKVNLPGLTFADVKLTKDTQDAMPVLAIEGTIRNTSRKVLEVPRLRFAVRNEGGEIYAWTALPDRPILAPGQSESFRTRLASPPAGGREVFVRFFDRRDLAGASD